MKRESIDIFYVDSRHEEIHQRLVNWANWVRVRPHYTMSVMFKLLGYRSNWRQWHEPDIRTPVLIDDAMLVEKSVCALPRKHRDVLVWWYVTKHPSVRAMRNAMGVTDDGLLALCNAARDMVKNTVKLASRSSASTLPRL